MWQKITYYYLGLATEILAIFYLTMNGHRLVEWRFKSKFGEVDLITIRNKSIYFIEVKYRSSFVDQYQLVSNKQSQRIKSAAKFYLSKHTYYEKHDVHLDLFAFSPPFNIQYYSNYFTNN